MKNHRILIILIALIALILIIHKLSKPDIETNKIDTNWNEYFGSLDINGEETDFKVNHPSSWQNTFNSAMNPILFKSEEYVTFTINVIILDNNEGTKLIENLLMEKEFIESQYKEVNESLGGEYEMKSFARREISDIDGVKYSSELFDGEKYCYQVDYRIIFKNCLITFYGSATNNNKQTANEIFNDNQEIFDAIVNSFTILSKKDNSLESSSEKSNLDDWYTVKDSSDNFSILFPAPPEYKKKEINSEFGFIQGRGYFLYKPRNDNNLAYSVVVADYKGVRDYNETELNEFFDYRKRGAIANINGEVILEEKLFLNQGQGRKYRILNTDKAIIATFWSYLIGEKLYMLSIITPREYDNNNNGYKFLESFEILINKPFDNSYIKRFGSNGCGKIVIPDGWKIHDETWNEKLENYSGTPLITIIRASDYDNTTFYVKLSTKKLEQSFTPEEIRSPENEFLNLFNEDLKATIAGIESSGNKVINSNYGRFISIGSAFGGVYDYTYLNQLNDTRKTMIHILFKSSTLYYLTISWNIEKATNPMQTVNALREEIKLCNLN